MSLYKRGSTFWVRFTAPNGQRIRCSAGTADRAQAQEYHDRLKADAWRIHKLGDRPRRQWQEAVVQWLKETSHKRTHEGDKAKLRWLDPFLRDRYLDEIDRDLVETVAAAKEAEGTAPATVNRYLALVRSILRKAAQEWGWLERAPKVRMRRENNRRVGFLTLTQANRLLAELPPHLAQMARFALSTGLRMTNVTGLEWSQVDLGNRMAWIHPDQAKAGRAIGVPLNAEAVAVLEDERGKHRERVFTFQGRPVQRTSTHAWYKACRRAGLEGTRWHDLRHTWASWHAQAGTPLSTLQELGGWSSGEMVKRYAHLSNAHLLEFAERIPAATKVAQHTG
ncbi:MAG TPA: site-specific integrase [Pseudomonadales bacterium]|nr:site-specific integrase [Pseudomonadales bacterium]